MTSTVILDQRFVSFSIGCNVMGKFLKLWLIAPHSKDIQMKTKPALNSLVTVADNKLVSLSVSGTAFVNENESGTVVCRVVDYCEPYPSIVGIVPTHRLYSIGNIHYVSLDNLTQATKAQELHDKALSILALSELL